MTTIRILGPDEIPTESNLCRPLRWDLRFSTCDEYGHPKNQFKWAPASACIPEELLTHLTVQELSENGFEFEFIEGDPPRRHKLDMRTYPTTPPKLRKP
jgi:hypothetical protein